ISPSGEQIALSYVPMNSSGRPKAIPNLELFSVNTGKLTLQVKTAQLPGGISFIGESRIATADTILPGLFGQSKIKVWDTNNGKLVMELADPKLGARRRVGASSNGAVVLGYIPHERVTGGRAWNTTIEQRFRLWDATTGRTIATSPPLLPIQPYHFAPDLDISANGRAVIVFSPGPYPIDIFSISQSAPAQPH